MKQYVAGRGYCGGGEGRNRTCPPGKLLRTCSQTLFNPPSEKSHRKLFLVIVLLCR